MAGLIAVVIRNSNFSKMKSGKGLFFLFAFVQFLACENNSSFQNNSKPFEISISTKTLVVEGCTLTIVTNNQLSVFQKSYVPGTRDSLLFVRDLSPSDTIQRIEKIRLDKLEKEYANPCIDDGLEITVTSKKGYSTKSVTLANYYQGEVGNLIQLVNSLLPTKYKIWYDKEELLAAY
ncbi:MAG: hypothetical protein JWQ30_1118, partial [Sediminibacterium sp.]|nr:hypothetical protein [Sediminibacterium sp.]